MKKYSASSRHTAFAYVLFGVPGVTPGAVPQSTPSGVQLLPPSQMRPMSIAAPGYSPALSTPSSAGAAGACGIVVFGSTDMLTASVPGPRVEFVVVTVIDRLRGPEPAGPCGCSSPGT